MNRAAERSLSAGRAARDRGDLPEAARRVGGAFARFQREGDQAGMARALLEVAVVALDADDGDTARRALGEALTLVDESEAPATVVALITAVARLASVEDGETAVRLFAGAAAWPIATTALDEARVHVGGAVLDSTRVTLGAEAVEALQAEASAMATAEVLSLARARVAS